VAPNKIQKPHNFMPRQPSEIPLPTLAMSHRTKERQLQMISGLTLEGIKRDLERSS
jgi:hypothetical protein